MLLRYAFSASKHLAASPRQIQRIRAPVGGVASSLREPTPLEVVDESDHRAPVNPKRDAEGLLGLALRCRQVAEHPEFPGMKVECGQALCEAPMGMRAQLRDQKPDTPAQSLAAHGPNSTNHKLLIPSTI